MGITTLEEVFLKVGKSEEEEESHLRLSTGSPKKKSSGEYAIGLTTDDIVSPLKKEVVDIREIDNYSIAE